jgi:heat shock protein HslJ
MIGSKLARLLPALLLFAACSKGPPAQDAQSQPPSLEAEPTSPSPDAGVPALEESGLAADPTAGPMDAEPSIENTHWRLSEVAGQPVAAANDRAEPHLVLFSDEKRAQGFGGCNRMQGPYEGDGAALTFGPIASTKMACDYPANPEDAFMKALAMTRSARIVDQRLELLDEKGSVLARFEARSAPGTPR